MLALVFGTFMIILDTTVVNVAFPTIRGELGADLGEAQWVISIYVLALGIAMPVSGFLGERFGLKRVYVAGLGVFVAGSVCAGFAPSLWLLVAARALQGCGGGLAQSLAAAMLFRSFPKERQGRAFGTYGIVLLVAPAAGPLLGGLLVTLDVWRLIFFINVPVGVAGVALAWLWIHDEGEPRRALRLDPLGVVTAVAGFGGVLYGAASTGVDGWSSPVVIASFAVGGVSLAAFALVELFHAAAPLLDLRLYRQRTFAVASCVGYVAVVALFGAEFLLPLYLQMLRGDTALRTGLMLLPMALTAGVTTPLAGRVYDRLGPRPLALAGFAVLSLNTWQLSKLDATTSTAWLEFLLVLRGFALGATLQSTITAALGSVARDKLPRGSSLVNATRRLVQSVGVAVLATILVSAASPASQELARHMQEEQAHAPRDTARYALCTRPPSSPSSSSPSPATIDAACRAYLEGFEHAYRLTFYLALLALALSTLLPGWPGRAKAGKPAVALTRRPAAAS